MEFNWHKTTPALKWKNDRERGNAWKHKNERWCDYRGSNNIYALESSRCCMRMYSVFHVLISFLYFHIHTPHSVVNCFLIFYVFPLPLFHLVVRLEHHLSIYYSFVFHLMNQWHHLIFALLLHFYHLHFTILFHVFHLLNV